MRRLFPKAKSYEDIGLGWVCGPFCTAVVSARCGTELGDAPMPIQAIQQVAGTIAAPALATVSVISPNANYIIVSLFCPVGGRGQNKHPATYENN